jgi:hypothetical protein
MHSSKVLVCVSVEDDDDQYVLEAMLPSKTDSWRGDVESKISSQLTQLH